MGERVGNAQRAQVQELLGKAFEEGYLDPTEFEQRTMACAAAKTVDDLLVRVSDLPAHLRWHPQQPPAPPPVAATSPGPHPVLGVTSFVLALVSLPAALCFGIGALFGIAAMVLGWRGIRGSGQRGLAQAGFIVGCLGVLVSIAILALFILLPDAPPPA